MTKPTPDEAKAIVEALQGQHPAIICYAQCEPCQWGMCYEEPTPHPWAGPEDIEHARNTGQPEPTGNCACPCARTEPARPRHPHDRPDDEPDERPVDDLKPSQEYL